MQYKIIVDKQSRANPSSEKKEYIIDIEELRVKGDVYDSLIITKDEDYVMRRLSLSKYHVLNVLDTPVKEPLNLNIELFEGDNYIYLMDMIGNKFYAEYLVKNDFTDIYVTRNEMNSSISQTAKEIDLNVNQKLSGYSTTKEMNSSISLKADEIKEEVSKTYATKNALEEEKSERVQNANSITQTVSSFTKNVTDKLATTEEKITKFEQDLDSIELSVTAVKDNTVENIVNGDFKNNFNNWTTSKSGVMEILTINNIKWLHMEIYAVDVPDSISQKLTALMKDTQYRLSFNAFTGIDTYTVRFNKYSHRIL